MSTVLVSGCSFDPIVSRVNPYRIDIRQGNYVDQAMVAQLKRGMSRDQVRFVLGSPLVSDVFRNDRWDYVYRFKSGKGEVEQRVLAVFFVDDRLDHLDGDVVTGDPVAASQAEQGQGARTIEVPPAKK
jgi:outer membrane protein assembly factor BamE